MSIDLASMVAGDITSGPGADFGKTVTFEKSNRKGVAAFTLNFVPVSGLPSVEVGKVDADYENWTAQAVLKIAECPYKPFVGQIMAVSNGPRCRVLNVTPDPLGGIYAVELEPQTRA